MIKELLIAAHLLAFVSCQDGHEPTDNEFLWGKFPDGFLWGTATSSYQIEGAWDVQGKGENIWDRFSHMGGKVANNDTGDHACKSYYKFEDDVMLLKGLGVDFYRFSISWARVMSDGTKATINQPGIDYYNMLINELLRKGIIPMVTMYHWDLPQHLQDYGGWLNDSMVQYFEDYADLLYKEFGDRVKHWMTFNEPWVVSWLGYGIGSFAPGYYDPAEGQYQAAHTIIKAHARAWHLYNITYRSIQNGEVGIVLNSDWSEPKDPNDPKDVACSERSLQFSLGWFANPIFINGDYPEAMKEFVGNKSIQQNYTSSRLPEFTNTEKAYIKGTSDFFGLNHYTTHYTEDYPSDINDVNYDKDKDCGFSRDPSWPGSGSSWLYVVPWGLRKLLNWVDKEYQTKIYVTENGVSDTTGTIHDDTRVYYYRNYINNVLKAAAVDGVDVRAYTAWSLMDNFEWASGYEEHFGIHAVDFTDPARPRVPKDSAASFSMIIADNGFVPHTSQVTGKPGTGGAISIPGTTSYHFVVIVILSYYF